MKEQEKISMKQIKIGTCVPGAKAEEWLKGFIGKGFETFSLNFHMSLEGTDLDKLALSTEKLLAGTDSKITTVGYYCNPIQYAEHRKTLENVICTAGKFGATHVSTFAGAWEGKPVESAYEEFGKVFRELADLAEEKGVKLGIENCLMDELKADQVLQEKAKSLPNVEIFVSSQTTEVVGNGDKVTGIRTKDRKTGEERVIHLDGIFVQIGLAANSGVFKEIVETNRPGEIVIDAHCRTNVPGIYAAGDVSTVPFKQIIISMGEGAKAALSAFEDRVRGVLG